MLQQNEKGELIFVEQINILERTPIIISKPSILNKIPVISSLYLLHNWDWIVDRFIPRKCDRITCLTCGDIHVTE